MRLPAELLDLARRQHGALARRQALDHITGPEYDGYVRHGRLERLHHGVAAIVGGARPPQQRLMAAVLRCGAGARVTGPAVLGLFDVDGFSPRDEFTVLVPPGRVISNVDFSVRADPLPDEDRATFGAIPIAKLPTSYLDAAAVLRDRDDRRLRVGLDSSCRKKLTTRQGLVARARQLGPQHAGAAWLLELECGGGLRADSEREREVLAVFARVHPQPEPQAWLAVDLRVDFLWPEHRLVVEYFGWVDHPRDDTHDARRLARIEALGYEVLVIRAADLRDPDTLATRVQLALVRRTRELGRAAG